MSPISSSGGGGGVTATGARAYMNAATQSIANGTNTEIALDTADWDTGTNFDATGHYISAPTAGYYIVTAQIVWSTSASGAVGNVYVGVNGTTTLPIVGGTPLSSVDNIYASVAVVLKLSLNDKVYLVGVQSSGGALNALGGASKATQLSVMLVAT